MSKLIPGSITVRHGSAYNTAVTATNVFNEKGHFRGPV